MLTEAEELEIAWRALSGQSHPTGRFTLPVGSAGTRIRAGVLYPAEMETLLVGFDLQDLPSGDALPEGCGFRIERTTDNYDPAWAGWLCLTRQDSAGRDMFALMAADIVSSVAAAANRPDTAVLITMLSRIRAWQDFMRDPGRGRLSQEEEVGLFGELTVLHNLVSHGGNVAGVVDSWVGPARGLQDFQGDNFALEVKSTISPVGFPARISSLDQLDPAAGRAVMLAAVRLDANGNGTTLPVLVERTRDLAAQMPRTSGALERMLMLAGYNDGAAASYTRKFECVEIKIFDADENFPRLIRSEMRPEIRDASYEIDLDLLKTEPRSFEQALARFGAIS